MAKQKQITGSEHADSALAIPSRAWSLYFSTGVKAQSIQVLLNPGAETVEPL